MLNKYLLLITLMSSLLSLNAQNVQLTLNPHTERYGVNISIMDGNLIQAANAINIKYEMTAKWLNISTDGYTIVLNRTSDVFVNNNASNLKVTSNIAVRCSEAIYPLVLRMDNKGKIEDIVNHHEIMQRWEATKKDLQTDFTGDGLKQYFYCNDKVFNQKEVMIHCFRNDRFMHAFSINIYNAYSSDNIAQEIRTYPFLFDCMGVEYTTRSQLTKSKRKYSINIYGELTDKRSVTDMKNENDFPYYADSSKLTGVFMGRYELNSEYNTIETAHITCRMEYKEDEGKQSSIIFSSKRSGGDENYKWPKVRKITGRGEKIEFFLQAFEDENREVQGLLNPLMDIRDMTRPQHNADGIKMGTK